MHAGQFNLGPCKRQPYEFDLRIPTMIAGPGVSPGRLPAVAGIPDLAPTILDLAGGAAASAASPTRDGRSLAPLLLAGQSRAPAVPAAPAWRDAYLIEYYATGSNAAGDVSKHLKDNANNTFVGLKVVNETMDQVYFEFTDWTRDWAFERANFCEWYDLETDPHQLTNLCALPANGSMAVQKAALRAQLYEQYHCAGDSCH